MTEILTDFGRVSDGLLAIGHCESEKPQQGGNPCAPANFPVPVLDDHRYGEAQESACPANRKQATNTIKGMDSCGGENNLTAGIEGISVPIRVNGSPKRMSDLNQQSLTLRHCNEQPKGDQATLGSVDSCRAHNASGGVESRNAMTSPSRLESASKAVKGSLALVSLDEQFCHGHSNGSDTGAAGVAPGPLAETSWRKPTPGYVLAFPK